MTMLEHRKFSPAKKVIKAKLTILFYSFSDEVLVTRRPAHTVSLTSCKSQLLVEHISERFCNRIPVFGMKTREKTKHVLAFKSSHSTDPEKGGDGYAVMVYVTRFRLAKQLEV